MGLVVSRAIGSAVRRNRVKRLCRECFRLSSWLPDGVDLVVIARAGAPELGLEDVRAEWRAVARLLKAVQQTPGGAARQQHREQRTAAGRCLAAPRLMHRRS